jgi:NADH-quinone oxidoreductase subunit M
MIQLGFPILLLSVLVPLALSISFPFLGKGLKPKKLAIISFILLLVPLIVVTSFSLTPAMREGVVDPSFFSHPFVGSFSMLLDPLSAPFAFGIALVTALVALFSAPYMEHRIEELKHEGLTPPSIRTYFTLYTMFSAAMLGLVLSTNLIEFYIFLELALIPSFFLIIWYGYGNRTRIAIMYLLWTHIGGLLFLLGVLTFGSSVGTFDILNMQTLTFNLGLGNALPIAVLLMITIGLFVKMAVFGVHIWLPYAHAEAPTPVSALLSPALIGISGYALIRISYTLFTTQFMEISIFLLGLALLTMIYGGLMALAQDDFKRLLAYSSISQMGYILLGISTLTTNGITGGMLHFTTHAVGKSVLFMVAGVLIVQFKGLRSISKMGGLASKVPITAALGLIGFLFLMGIPPTLGLWSKLHIVVGTFDRILAMGALALVLISITLVVATGITAAYSFFTLKRIFLGKLPRGFGGGPVRGWSNLTVVVAIVAIVGVVLFFYPAVFIDPLKDFLGTIL